MYYNKNNQTEIRSSIELKKAFPNISFPKFPTDEQLLSFGLIKIETIQDEYNSDTQKLVKQDLEITETTCIRRYLAVNLTEEELQSRLPLIIESYKSYYLEVWNEKLKELDYDGIETVIFWKTTATDQTFKTEATRLASWYEAMITFNYTTLNAVSAGTMVQPTKEEYLALLPKFEDTI